MGREYQGLKDRLLVSLGGNAFVPENESMTMLGQFEFAAATLALSRSASRK